MGCPNCHEPYMSKSIEIHLLEEWEVFRCGRCQTRYKVFYDNETPDERAMRIKRREEKEEAKELYRDMLGIQSEGVIS